MSFLFQHTEVYKQSLLLLAEVEQTFEKKESSLLKNKIIEKVLCVIGSITKTLTKESSPKKSPSLQNAKENINVLIALFEIAKIQNKLNPEEEKNLVEKCVNLQNKLAFFEKKRPRILILSASMGQGHISASKAIKEGLERLYGYDFQIEIIDFGEILSSTINKASVKVYEGSIKYVPSLYEFLFDSTNKKWQVKLLNLINYPFSFNRLTKFFEDQKPDLVLSTHPFWDYIALKIWKKQKPEAKFLSMITDSISIHEAWVVADTDYHFVANDDTFAALEKLGIEKEKIKNLGFPIRLDFLEPTDRSKFLREMNLDPEKFTLLFLTSSVSKEKVFKIMQELMEKKDEFNLLVVTGKNLKLKPKLAQFENEKNVRIFDWTDKLADFIKASDLVITKAGGATVMECIAAKKPMIITQIVPGQERGNAELIENYQLGIIPSAAHINIIESITHIQNNLESFQKNLKLLSNPEAALNIAKFIHGILK